jgi:hypothetical protein
MKDFPATRPKTSDCRASAGKRSKAVPVGGKNRLSTGRHPPRSAGFREVAELNPDAGLEFRDAVTCHGQVRFSGVFQTQV